MVSSLSSDTSFKLSSSHSHSHVWHKWVAFSQAIQTPSRVNFILSNRKSGGCLWCQCAFLGILTWGSPLFCTLMLRPSHFSTEGRYLMVFTYLVYMCVKVLHACVCSIQRPKTWCNAELLFILFLRQKLLLNLKHPCVLGRQAKAPGNILFPLFPDAGFIYA